jgi:hypothetical protein
MALPHSTRRRAARSCRRASRSILLTLAFALLGGILATSAAATPTGRPVVEPTLAPTPSATPIVIAPDKGLYTQFGYSPPFTRNAPSFDAAGRPYIRSRSADPDYTGFVHTWLDSAWRRLDMTAALKAAYPDYAGTQGGGGGPAARIIFDAHDRAYTVVSIRLRGDGIRNVLLWSTDHCATWHVVDLPQGDVVPESWTGHNDFDGPPPLLVGRVGSTISPDTGKLVRELWFTRPHLAGETVIVPEPVMVSARSLSLGDGATTASPMATRGDTTWIVYAETTTLPGRGSPVSIVTYRRGSGVLGKPVLLAWSRLGNDGHAQPGIALDSKGYLHLVAGAHGRSFQYRRTLVPNTAYEGWSQLEPVATTGYRESIRTAEEGRQTYLAFVCDAQDRLHVVYRQWRKNTDTAFNGDLYGALSYQRRDALLGWTAPRPVIVPPYGDYSIYAQALSLDRSGRLFISASCVAGSEGSDRKAAVAAWRQAGSDGPQPPLYLRRMVLVSTDNGDSWRFADTADLTAGMTP